MWHGYVVAHRFVQCWEGAFRSEALKLLVLGKQYYDFRYIIKQMGEWLTVLGETVAASAPSLHTFKERLGRLLESRI